MSGLISSSLHEWNVKYPINPRTHALCAHLAPFCSFPPWFLTYIEGIRSWSTGEGSQAAAVTAADEELLPNPLVAGAAGAAPLLGRVCCITLEDGVTLGRPSALESSSGPLPDM